jgi:hypothetical protein
MDKRSLRLAETQVSKGAPQGALFWTNTHEEHWPGLLINYPRGPESPYASLVVIRQMVKPMLDLAGRVLFKANCQGGPINPDRVRNTKSRNITPV